MVGMMVDNELESRLMVLMFTDLVGSVDLKTRLGASVYANLISRHDTLFRQIISGTPAAEIRNDTGDGFLARFATATDAVCAALRFQYAMHAEPWDPEPLRIRIAVHIGQVTELDTEESAGVPKLVGLAADITARIVSLGLPGQILLTRTAFDDARQYVREHPATDGSNEVPQLRWVAHGPYLFKGSDEPLDVFEVGAVGTAPLKEPPDNEKARRAVTPGEEELLGWRPAIGLEIPGRPQWFLDRKLGEGGFGEVWIGRHKRMKTARVFKFCHDAQRVRSLKREMTLFRLLRGALGDRPDIATIHEVRLDQPPFFLESEYSPEGDLSAWAARRGGIETLALETRLDLIARTADAVAAAHSVGILHKDIKPSNILIKEGKSGTPRPCLADFGIGVLTDPTHLERADITVTGFTETLVQGNEYSRTGTRLYAPPEILAGEPFTIQGDVYALGVLLYQVVIGDLRRPLAQGWEADIDDPTLREDIARCVAGRREERLGTANELALRLRKLPQRRRAGRRRRITRLALAASVILAVLAVPVGIMLIRESGLRRDAERQAEIARAAEQQARDALAAKEEADRQRDAALILESGLRRDAKRQAEIAQSINEFLNDDLLAAVAPSVEAGRGRDVLMRDVLDVAAQRIDEASDAGGRFEGKRLIEASIRATLGDTYLQLGEYAAAEPHLERALQLRRLELGEEHPDTLASMYSLAILYWNQGRYDEAETLCDKTREIRRHILGEEDPTTLDSMNLLAIVYVDQGRFDEAEQLQLKTLEIKERVLGQEHPSTLASIHNLAHLYWNQGRYDEAEPLHVKTLQIQKRVLGEEDPTTLDSMNGLALLYVDQGRYDDAEALYVKTLEIQKRVLGEEHPDTLRSMGNLAALYWNQSRYDDAEPLFVTTLEIKTRVLGAEHPETLRSMSNLATLYRRQNRYDEAEPLYLQALELKKRVLGEEHPSTLDSMNRLAILYVDQGRYDEAEPLQVKTLEIRKRVLGEDHPVTLFSMINLARLYVEQERFEEADALQAQAVDASRRAWPEGTWFTGAFRASHGRTSLALHQYREAEEALVEAHEILIASLGSDHERTIGASKALSDLYDAWHEAEPDQGYDTKAAEWRAKLPDEVNSNEQDD